MNDSSYVRHRRKMDDVQPVQPELNDPNELEVAIDSFQASSAVPIYSQGTNSSIINEIREEIKNGDGSTFFFDSENEMFPESFSEDYLDFLFGYE